MCRGKKYSSVFIPDIVLRMLPKNFQAFVIGNKYSRIQHKHCYQMSLNHVLESEAEVKQATFGKTRNKY